MRSAIEWRDLYEAHKREVDDLILKEQREDDNGTKRGPTAAATTGKRRREDDTQASATESEAEPKRSAHVGATNGTKKRRIEQPVRPRSPITNGPPTPPPDFDPVVFVPGTPPSRQRTPLPPSNSNAAPNGKTGSAPTLMPTVALNAIPSAFEKGKYGQYGVPGSPIGSQVPQTTPASSQPLPKPKPNGVPIAVKPIFPQSLPSLTPALREKTTSREAVVTPRQGDVPGVQVDDTTPDAGKARQATNTNVVKESSIFAQVGQETPRNEADHSRQEIFPHTLPHLTPALRLGPHGENEYIINEDSVVFASQNEHDDINTKNGEALFPTTVPNLTPTLRPGPHGETKYIIRDDSIQFLENINIVRSGTPEQNALDDDEFEGPSPMPYLGSDRHSSRSFSFSHGDDIIEGLAKALAGHSPHELRGHSQEVDELEEDDSLFEKEKGPRAVVSKKLPPPRSPVFASSSEDDEILDHHHLLQVKGKNAVKAKPVGRGAVRAKAPRKSTEMDTDSESGSDKENGAVSHSCYSCDFAHVVQVESQAPAPVEMEDVFHPGSPLAIEDDRVSERMAATSLQEGMDETPDGQSSLKSLHFSGKTPPSAETVATQIKSQAAAGANIPRPATAPPVSKGAAAILNRYGTSVLEDRGSKSTLLKAALSYPSPNIPSELEEALRRKEEPSPLQRLAEKAIGRAKAAALEDAADAAGKARHGKVRFDGVAIDRDRRKTTGGIGTTFGTGVGNGIVSDAVAGPSHSRFKAAPAIFGSSQRSRNAGAASHEIHLDRKKEDIIDLDDDDEEEDDSPLAKYTATARGTSSPQKSAPGRSDRYRSSSLGRSTTAAGARFPPPPPAVQVPIYISSSPMPASSPPAHSTAQKPTDLSRATASIRDFSTMATWSPVRFGQPSALVSASASLADGRVGLPAPPNTQQSHAGSSSFHLEAGDVPPSIGFRDQDADAEWVSAVHGRPSITSMEIRAQGRSAPLPSEGDIVVYSSRARSRPSHSRSTRRQSSARGNESSGVDALAIISDADRQRILNWLEENRNPDVPPEEDEDEDEQADRIFEGLGLMFETMAAKNGFVASVPRNVWKQCGDLEETAEVVQAMTDAANNTGLEVLEARQKRNAQLAMESREAVLAGEVDGRRKSGRYSLQVSALSSPFGSDGEQEPEARRGRRSGTRSTREGQRPRPPSYVPAEVVEPLSSQL